MLRSPFDVAPDNNYPKNTDGGTDGTAAASKMVPTRDTDDLPKKKRTMINDEQNVVTGELIQVLHSKQKRIDELERRLKSMEQQESQWRVHYRAGHVRSISVDCLLLVQGQLRARMQSV